MSPVNSPSGSPTTPRSRSVPNADLSHYIAIPDYVGKQVRVIAIDDPKKDRTKNRLSFLTPNCNPNSVAFNQDRLYVVCNNDWNNGDKILVYQFHDLAATRPQGTEATPIKTILSPEFDSLIAIAFDSQDALWVSSYNNHQIVKFSNSALNSDNPQIDKKLIHSPDNPVGLAFDQQDGSLWVTGHYEGGLVIQIPKSELDSPGNNVNGVSTVDAKPTVCFANSAWGCKQIAGLFEKPQGIAILNNEVWVSNHGGDHPAASVVRLRPNQEEPTKFGGGVGNPFFCPGGLATDGARLWINDQSLGKTNTTCGVNDSQSDVDGVLVYNASDLSDPNNIGSPSEVLKDVTSRPGFGGITVFSCSIKF